MLTGELRSQIDAIWKLILTSGIANPLRLGIPGKRRLLPEGQDAKGCTHNHLVVKVVYIHVPVEATRVSEFLDALKSIVPAEEPRGWFHFFDATPMVRPG